jgi:hypothetical protein
MSESSAHPSGANPDGLSLADDLLRSAEEIAVFLYGRSEDPKEACANTRRIYHMKDKHGFPAFKMGGVLSARKSTILKWIEQQERGSEFQAA